MPLVLPLVAILLGTALLLLQGSLSEELLLLVASTLFFAVVFSRLRSVISGWVASQADELYALFGSLLELRLLRLAALVGLGRRLGSLAPALDRFLLVLAPLFALPPPPTPLPPLGFLARELVAAPAALDRLGRQRRLRLLANGLGGFSLLLADRFGLIQPLEEMYREFSALLAVWCVAAALALALFGLSFLLVPRRQDSEKVSAYECGFDPFEDSRGRFDVRFYLVAILFIVFDLEVSFLFPWSLVVGGVDLFGYGALLLFLVILTLGFLYEWVRGALDW
jgi:NADH:ubiquinone oxidoreductase subunit 3 (subunit A)